MIEVSFIFFLLYFVRIHILFFYKSISVLSFSIFFHSLFILFFFYFLGIAEFAKEGAERNLGAPKVHLSFTLDGSGMVTLSKAEVNIRFLSYCIVLCHIVLCYILKYCTGLDRIVLYNNYYIIIIITIVIIIIIIVINQYFK